MHGGRRQSIFVVPSQLEAQENRWRRDKSITSSCTFSQSPSAIEEYGSKKSHKVKCQNTYKLEPDKRFSACEVERLIEQILMDHLDHVEYSENVARRLVRVIADKVIGAVKKLRYKRYKLVAVVNIGEVKRQSVRVASRCLWQTAYDNFGEGAFENSTLWCTVAVFGMYQE